MNKYSKGYEEISGSFWWIFIHSAKQRNIEVEFDIKFLWNLYLKQNRKCALSGLPIILDKFGRKKDILKDGVYFASLDRVNNKLGYYKNNVRWLAREINLMKWKLTDDEFLFFCKNISKNS